jgi:hypothetical protein
MSTPIFGALRASERLAVGITSRGRRKMQKWEYKIAEVSIDKAFVGKSKLLVVEDGNKFNIDCDEIPTTHGVPHFPKEATTYLNNLGLQGWELVSVVRDVAFVFKRSSEHEGSKAGDI